MAKEIGNPNSNMPPEVSKGGGFSVQVHQPEMLFKIANGETDIAKKPTYEVEISNTEFDDAVLESEATTLRPDTIINIPAGLITAEGRGLISGPRNLGTFSLRSRLRLSQTRSLRVDHGYYTEERLQKIKEITEGFGSKTMLFPGGFGDPEFMRGVNYLLIEHNGIFADAIFGFPDRKTHEGVLREDHQSEEEKETLEEEILPNLEGPSALTLHLRGRKPQTESITTINRFEDMSDFHEQILTYAKIYENLVRAIYAEDDQSLPQKPIILRPPILDQDALTEMQSLDTEEPAPVVKEQLGVVKFSFDDISGQEVAVKEAKRLVFAINNPEIYERRGARRPKGILLYGPSGTGKTLLAKIIANEAEAAFFEVSASDIGTKWYGESEKLMQRVFNRANRAATEGKKVVIFFDEIDALAPARDESYETTRRVVATLLQNMDGMRSNPNVTVIAASNRPEGIDPALKRPGRFDKLIEVGLPNEQGRIDILKLHIDKARDRATAPNELFGDIDLQELVSATEKMSGADIANLINLTIEEKTMRELEETVWSPITAEDIIDMAKKLTQQREEKKKIGFLR